MNCPECADHGSVRVVLPGLNGSKSVPCSACASSLCPLCSRPAHPDAYCFGQEPPPVEDDRPAASDTTGELREAVTQVVLYAMQRSRSLRPSKEGAYEVADALFTLPALRDLIAERDTLAAQVQAVEGEIAAHPNAEFDPIASYNAFHAICRALGAPTTGGGE